MKAWACVGSHGKVRYTAVASNRHSECQDRLEIYMTEKAARKNDFRVREVTITVHREKKEKK